VARARLRGRFKQAREGTNRLIGRATGYQLRRVAAGGLPLDFDAEACRIIAAVRPYTMTDPEKLYALVTAVRYVHDHGICGAVVECGVWRGGSMQAAALALTGRGASDRDLYLFDTFDGMTPPGPEDRWATGLPAEDILAVKDPDTAGVWARASLADVRAGFSHVPYPGDRIHFVPGPVEDTVPREAPDEIAVLRLDTDWYASTRHELRHLYPRLVPGGVLIVDDYGDWQGARDATDEFLAECGDRVLLVRVSGSRVAVKP
jgi:hypothetical protein